MAIIDRTRFHRLDSRHFHIQDRSRMDCYFLDTGVAWAVTSCQRPLRWTKTVVNRATRSPGMFLYVPFTFSTPVTIATLPYWDTFMSSLTTDSGLKSPEANAAISSALSVIPPLIF